MPKNTLITGIIRKYRSYSAKSLLSKSYVMHKINRWVSLFNARKVDHICQTFTSELYDLIQEVSRRKATPPHLQDHMGLTNIDALLKAHGIDAAVRLECSNVCD